MGIVSDYLRNAIVKQIADHGLVIWYDPERHYTSLAETLKISNTAVVGYDGSFFALRQAVEPLLEGVDPPRLVVYLPLDPAETHNALIELETAGVVVKPGQQPPARNTRLALIARNALRPLLGEEMAASIEKQVEAGQLNLADLDALAEKGVGSGVVSIIFGTGNPQEVALSFLTSPDYDADLLEKGAGAELAALLHNAFEIDLPDDSLESQRKRLAQHILVTDFLSSVTDVASLPQVFSLLITHHASLSPAAREACLSLAKTWRLRRDLRESYVAHAGQVEKSLNLAGLDFDLAQIAGVETFLPVEQQLQRQVAVALLSKAADQLVETARLRQSSFWSEALPDAQAEWALIAVSGQVLLEADRIQGELKQPSLDVKTIFERYTGSDKGIVTSDESASSLVTGHSSLIPRHSSLITDHSSPPWCLLDTYYRHMERRCHHFEFDLAGRHDHLEKLIAKARDRYMTVGARLAKTFLQQYQRARFQIADVPYQAETFERQVKPNLTGGKTAYVWVDALRFEMARELAHSVADEFEVKLQAAVGMVPTITEIGMAALLPGAHQSPAVVSAGGGKLGLEINSTLIKDRKGRVDYLAAHAGVAVFAARLDDLVPKPSQKVGAGIQAANLVLITSQEIDSLCEGDNIPLARRIMDEVLHELRRALRVLAELGVGTIILTADHGYLFGEEPGEEMKLDAPGGDTVDLHRRVWIGRGGAGHPACLRVPLAQFGLSDEFDLMTPWNFAIFRVPGGARAYFHGGLSPQELVIPILTLTPRQPVAAITGEIEWTLRLGTSSHKIGRFCSVQVGGQARGLFELAPPKVRVEARARGEVISTPVTASYGFEEGTGDIQLELKADDPRAIEPNTIALRITDDTPQKNVTIHLLDAASGVELARLGGIEVAISV